MSIQINRFCKKNLKTDSKKIAFTKKSSVIIWDHKHDEIIGYINLYDTLEENNELADKIIETIETHIMENENGSSE